MSNVLSKELKDSSQISAASVAPLIVGFPGVHSSKGAAALGHGSANRLKRQAPKLGVGTRVFED